MATTTANITWQPVPGSLSTLVEYKLHTDSTWITPLSPNNPTIFNTYPLTITEGVTYDVRLTTNGATCTPKSITLQIFAPQGSCCPIGYTLSDDGTYCFQTNTTAATPPSSPENTVAESNINYTVWASLIYNPGYNINGTGSFTQIPFGNTFWVNGAGFPTGAGADLVKGPMNRAGLWATTTMDNQDVGFSICITAPVDGTYYVGIGVDNYAIINIDGNNVLTMDPTAMGVFLSANGYPGVGIESTFRFFHIYPITLTTGNHVVEIIGHNINSVAAVAVEVYNATASQIQSAISYVDLGSELIFSSKDFIGQPVQVGSGGTGYTCPPGYSLVLCEGPAFCRQILTTPTIPCP